MKYVASAADEKPSDKGWIKMTTLLECYKILEQYPDSMTKDQFYRIAHISKRHAKYLLDSGLVPCHDSGKRPAAIRFKPAMSLPSCATVRTIPTSTKLPRDCTSGTAARQNAAGQPPKLSGSILQSRKRPGCTKSGNGLPPTMTIF